MEFKFKIVNFYNKSSPYVLLFLSFIKLREFFKGEEYDSERGIEILICIYLFYNIVKDLIVFFLQSYNIYTDY